MCRNYNKYVLQLWKMSVSKEAQKRRVCQRRFKQPIHPILTLDQQPAALMKPHHQPFAGTERRIAQRPDGQRVGRQTFRDPR
jgi:hypothetical protein